MAEVIRISESAEPAAAALPQNVEAEAALLGALMIDNRLVEDVQLKLRPHHFFEPLHGRIYESILRLTDKNMVANPVTLRPSFEADEAMKELGGPAYLAQLTGSGAIERNAQAFHDRAAIESDAKAFVEALKPRGPDRPRTGFGPDARWPRSSGPRVPSVHRRDRRPPGCLP